MQLTSDRPALTQELKQPESLVTFEESRYVGKSVKRVEDPRLLTGSDQFVDNLKFPNMVFAGFLRSPYAHATIKKIDLSKIDQQNSVVAIITPEEVREKTNPIPVLWRVPNSKIHEHYALAQKKVVHVGDPVLAVAVEKREVLEDVIDSINVEYELLEPVLDPLTADRKLPIHQELESNTCFTVPMSTGDVEKAFEEADLIVQGRFEISRIAACPMETRGVLANPADLHSTLTVYSSTQWPHPLRTLLAFCLRMEENYLRVIGPDVGGGFGVKGEVYSEEVLVSLLALKCKRPVKWIESRRESFVSTTHARDQILEGSASFKNDGTLTGLKVNFVCDFGAYLHTITPGSAFITALSLCGPYVIPNFSVVAKGVYTNKVGLSAYRGFGQPEAAFTVERLMSIAASKLGMDSSELRFKNLISPDKMPYRNATGGVIDSGEYATCLREALNLANYEKMIAQRDRARKTGKLSGIGISLFTETSGFAPGFVFRHLGLQLGGYDIATVKMDPQGKLVVTSGAFPHGQGFNTTVSQICADELGLELSDVFAFHGDTYASPYGQGSFGSRTVAVAGNAALLAARKLKEKILKLGAFILKAQDSKDLFLTKGFMKSRLDSSILLPISEIARAAYLGHDLPEGFEPGLEATVVFQPLGLTTSYAANIAQVEVDPETGSVSILKIVTVHDCGKQINPMIVEGQIQGSIAQAIGACLLEEISYDSQGQLQSGSFLDYLIPLANAMPELVLGSTAVETPINPLGAKGVGENGTIITPPAIANAVSDAIAGEMNILPMTPERVLAALHSNAR
jgi:aerobic carbon-monoxide dehydrogenase large subunit